VTHSFNENQRFKRLNFTLVPNGLTVTVPNNPNVLPPGYYMLFILNGDGVPSRARILRIDRGFSSVDNWCPGCFDQRHGWNNEQYVRTIGDVSGDSKADLVGFGLNGVYVAPSTGSSFVTPPSNWCPGCFDQLHGWNNQQHVRTVGNVNGDDRADLVGFGLDGVYVALALNPGPGFGPVSKWCSGCFDQLHGWNNEQHVRTVGDVDGDGKVDLIGFGLDGVYVALALNPGPGFGPVSRWCTGCFDQLHGWNNKDYVRTVGDVNGDDKVDLVGFGLDGVYVALALNPGPGFGPVSKWCSGCFDQLHGWNNKDYVRTVGDLYGDGKADLVGFGLDGVYIALSTGKGFIPVSRWTSAFDLSHSWTVSQHVRTSGDASGDGQSDLVGFGLDGVYVASVK
jgi:hypothetical protein